MTSSPDDTIPIPLPFKEPGEPHIALVMAPPEGFVERAVANALAVVAAEEALIPVEHEPSPLNDAPNGAEDLRATIRITPIRKRCDSGVIDMRELGTTDDEPASARR